MSTPQTKTPDTIVFVIPEKLSDGSVAYNVRLGDHVWHAVTYSDAHDLAEKIVDAINDHACEQAGLIVEG